MCSVSDRFASEDEWYDALTELASEHGVSVADRDAWTPDYPEKSPEDSLYGEYPEYRPTGGLKRPCKACPWRRNSAPGWLGSATAGEFMGMSLNGLHLPCHLTVDYEKPEAEWRAAASAAPACAGHAIYLANTCQAHKQPSSTKLPADKDLVFSRPHEFIAHHTNQRAADLENVTIYDLIK